MLVNNDLDIAIITETWLQDSEDDQIWLILKALVSWATTSTRNHERVVAEV